VSRLDNITLGEIEHQALDRLDALAAARWTSLRSPRSEDLSTPQGTLDSGEDPGEVAEAIEITRTALVPSIARAAADLLLAAEALARTEDRGELRPAALESVRAMLDDDPEIAPALAAAVEITGIVLGLDRAGLAWATLIDLGEQTHATAPEQVQACSRAIAERFAAATPKGGPERNLDGGDPTPRALRVFRSAAVAAAGPSIRARFLAADHPEQLDLASALVEELDDPALLVDRFDAALATLAEDPRAGTPGPEAVTDGPKRKFTAMHLTLALILLGLTIWHYWFR
jgi:hypothetical protein